MPHRKQFLSVSPSCFLLICLSVSFLSVCLSVSFLSVCLLSVCLSPFCMSLPCLSTCLLSVCQSYCLPLCLLSSLSAYPFCLLNRKYEIYYAEQLLSSGKLIKRTFGIFSFWQLIGNLYGS
jgi:hypothetical protein